MQGKAQQLTDLIYYMYNMPEWWEKLLRLTWNGKDKEDIIKNLNYVKFMFFVNLNCSKLNIYMRNLIRFN